MNARCALLLMLALTACGKSITPDTVESLTAHPDRLNEVMRQCREDRAEAGDALCNAASEAFRLRFIGDGKGQYTPRP
jgi:hypothetical protein